MKKTYINPDITIVNIQISPILTGSNPEIDPTSSFSEESNVGSRSDSDLWNDE